MEERMPSIEIMHGTMSTKLSIHCYCHVSADRGPAYPWRGAQWHILGMQIERISKSSGKSWTDFCKELCASTSFLFQLS